MASPQPLKLLLCLFVVAFTCISRGEGGQVEEASIQLMTEPLEWPSTMSLYDDELGDDEGDMEGGRRSLFWHAMRHYYISYGALSANRIPCPPRSGRSYYTHNCYRARGPVHPYTRGCSRITRCRR